MSTDDSLSAAASMLRRQALEAQLAGLRPTAATLDRDRLMFEAGRAATGPSRWSRTVALVAAAGVALVVGRWTAPVRSPDDRAGSPLTNAHTAAPLDDVVQSAEFRDPSSLLQLRLHLDDLDAGRGSIAAGSASPFSPHELMRELLN
jgi:hypothetical protein